MEIVVPCTSYVHKFFEHVYGAGPYNLDLNQRERLRGTFKDVPSFSSVYLTVHTHARLLFITESPSLLDAYFEHIHMYNRGVFGLNTFFTAMYAHCQARSGFESGRASLVHFMAHYGISEDDYSLDNASRQLVRMKKTCQIYQNSNQIKPESGRFDFDPNIDPGLFFSQAYIKKNIND